jgi:hypothetical protein
MDFEHDRLEVYNSLITNLGAALAALNHLAYCTKIRKLEGHFEGIEFQHVPCNNNVATDVLSKLGSRRALVPAGVLVQDLHKPSVMLLDPDNPEPPPNDQNLAPHPPPPVTCSCQKKKMIGASPS